MNSHYDLIVVGGGPAGCISAGFAAKKGKSVCLIEKNNNIGRKLAITGKGRCNITNNCDSSELLKNVVTNSKFLYSAFNNFNNFDTIDFFNKLGVPTKVERGDRVFPESDNAFHVVDALKKFLILNKVNLMLNSNVTDIKFENNCFNVTLENKGTITSDKLVLATGGMSYKGTGSTGDGYKFAKALGHKVIEPKPSLVPLEVKEVKIVKDLMGLSLKNVEITIKNGDKKIVSDFGEMIFTHFGVSGPIILSSSAYIVKQNINGLKLEIDFKPALSLDQLDKRLQKDFQKNNNKHFNNSLDELLPKKLIPVIVALSGIPQDKPVNQITKDERNQLCKLLKSFQLTLTKTRPIEEAIITSGGIAVSEINPSTMESKKCKGLYFCGELIDVDAFTGGFNLQIAYSTGYLCGENS